MPKRGRSASSHWNFPAGTNVRSSSRSRSRSHSRKGYGSVARSRGAAVTGEMKYFDCAYTGTAMVPVTTTWGPTTIIDPTSTINLGDAAVATPGCLFAPKPTASLNGRIGRKVAVYSIKVRGQIFGPVTQLSNTINRGTTARVMLVLDQQTTLHKCCPQLC